MMHSHPVRFVLATAVSATIAATAGAMDDSPRRSSTPTPLPDNAGLEFDVRAGARQGLLREGSHLLQAQGRFAHDPEMNVWRFAVNPVGEHSPVYVLTALPSSYLSEAQQVVEASSQHGLVFEVTGEVLVYKGRNYLLLTHPPRVVGHSAADETETAEPAKAEPQDQEQPAPQRDAESIMRDLEREIGPVQRRPGASRNGGAEDNRERVRRAADARLMREGSNVIMRRGRISRDVGGTWLFVFDADASGLADPPMTLMPCLLLERLERHFQTRGNAPLLLSGRVFLYDDRNYLLPTVFQLPRERETVMP